MERRAVLSIYPTSGWCRGIAKNPPLCGGLWEERGHGLGCGTGRLFGCGGGWQTWAGERPTPLPHRIAGGLDCLSASRKISRLRIAPVTAGRSFPPCTKLFLANSHQNSHSPKIKMAALLAASHLIDFIVLLAPQVGLEPTTLRLTAECSAIELLRSIWRKCPLQR